MTVQRLTRISRRRLLGSGAAASVLAASGLAAEAAPRRGGTLRIAAPPPVFDRLLAPGSTHDCLTEVDADGGLRGELARTWQDRDGGLRWVVGLREDARFHNGAPVVAEDVVKSMRAHAQAGTGALANLRQVTAAAPDTAVFRLAAPDPQFPFRLSDPALVVYPDGDPTAPAGSGLYQVAETGPGLRAKLTRVPAEGRRQRSGWFDRVELLGISPEGARLDALLAGRVDLAFDLGAEAPAAIARARRLVAATLPVATADGAKRMRVGHVARLRGFDARDPLRVAERGYFA